MMFYLVNTDAYLTLSIACVTIYISPTFSNGGGEIKKQRSFVDRFIVLIAEENMISLDQNLYIAYVL